MLSGTANDQTLQPMVSGLFPRRETDLADNFGLIGSPALNESLAIKKTNPVLRATVRKITVSVDAGRAESSRRVRVQHGVNRKFDELEIGFGRQRFLGERHPVLTAHDIEILLGLEIQIHVTDCKSGTRLKHKSIVELLSIVALNAKTSTPHDKGVRRRAIPFVKIVLCVHVSDGHERKIAVGTLQKEMLVVPSSGYRRSAAGLFLKCVALFLNSSDVGRSGVRR